MFILDSRSNNLDTNKQKIANLPPKFWKFHTFALKFYQDISNDFLMPYVIETDVPVCIFICLDVYFGFKDQHLVNNKQKIADLAS